MSQVVVESFGGTYTQRISGRGHEWLSDEPEESGGNDRGPTPYQLLLASLGACTSITAQMYARRKGWPLEGVRVELEHQRVHARDCDGCESREGFVSKIEVRIAFSGELDEEQRQRLLEIAGKCPVKKTLQGEVIIKPELVL